MRARLVVLPVLVVGVMATSAACGADHGPAGGHGAGPMGSSPDGTMSPGHGTMSPGHGQMAAGHGGPMSSAMSEGSPMDGSMAPGHGGPVGVPGDHGSPAVPGARTVAVRGDNFAFAPPTVTMRVDETINVELTAVDLEHDFVVDEFDTHVHANPGQTTTGALTADRTGAFEIYCSIPGHREAGMTGTLVVSSS